MESINSILIKKIPLAYSIHFKIQLCSFLYLYDVFHKQVLYALYIATITIITIEENGRFTSDAELQNGVSQ